MTRGIDVIAFLRPTWVFREEAREAAEALGFADEMTASVSLTWTRKKNEGKFVAGTGYGLLLFYKEQGT